MINVNALTGDLERVREKSPLIHNITNYVVMNNTANALLSIGASPVMAHAVEEVADMVQLASALVINIGTLSREWVEAMIVAGQTACRKGIPVVLDPVGAGATAYRTNVCRQLVEICKPTIIRGNASEIMSLVNSGIATKGVDSADSSDAAIDSAKALALAANAVVVVSGPTDYITDGQQLEVVKNGNPMMARVTGLGCTATAVTAAFAAVNSDALQAAAHGMAVMSIAGERAASKAVGNGSMQVLFLDELYNLDAETIRKTIRL
ncbi:MAG: hydroxyethylthiazole kinase [Dysgonamonadaceae bacterium]|jgi:hydroxyethylthiazole kinase|nr:hydroxyethylthiazole kinase [Dysgonamonadaceae bacterium]